MKELLNNIHLLKNKLLLIEKHDPSSFTFNPKLLFNSLDEYYKYRNSLVEEAVIIAKKCGYKAGFLIHQPIEEIIEEEWDIRCGVVAYIELPTGQVSWHLESPKIKYDGHSYREKHDRIDGFLKGNIMLKGSKE